MSEAEALAKLTALRRLPGNKRCPNCGTESRLGFTAVCVKYATFVCDVCKSSHQAFSHRTKSVTMSHWTMDEVKPLDEANGGGNDAARRVWFARMSDADRAAYQPREGDDVDKFKQFVQLAYEEQKWRGDPSSAVAASNAAAAKPAAAPVQRSRSAPAPYAGANPTPTLARVVSAPSAHGNGNNHAVGDLLDFSAPAAVSTPSSAVSAPSSSTPAFFDPFAAAAPSAAAAPPSMMQPPALAPMAGFAFMAAPPVTTSANARPPVTVATPQPPFDPFASLNFSAPAASSFGAFPPVAVQAMPMGVGMGMGMGPSQTQPLAHKPPPSQPQQQQPAKDPFADLLSSA